MAQRGLFVGMVTLDLIYLVKSLPSANEKMMALNFAAAAGGPATNAAVAYRYLGNPATLMGVVGKHPIRSFVEQDLQNCGVAIADLNPDHDAPLTTSSIMVTQATGERAVVYMNAAKAEVNAAQLSPAILNDVAIVLIDGHQMQVGRAIAHFARSQGIPVVVDGGSWKPGFEQVLPLVDYAICSANFFPPGCTQTTHVFDYLTQLGIPHMAITQGDRPILYRHHGKSGEISVPTVAVVDTLAAGDIVHGAFCHFILALPFEDALKSAAQIAAQACQSFGTRQWMEHSNQTL